MRYCLLIIISFAMFTWANAKNGITFKIEKLTSPEKLLKLESFEDIIKEMILADNKINERDTSKVNHFPYGIVAKSSNIDSAVSYGYHPFFNGMYQAYADHRPFTISPDMIWLLICQGFSNHVNNNSEELRDLFVSFKGKTTIVINNDKINLANPDSPWEEMFSEFSKKVGENLNKNLEDILTCNFSTTSSTEKVASQVTMLETFQPYFEYIVFSCICGIPEITLEGTPEDWLLVRDKARALRQYKLDWWMDELDPLLHEFVNASKGKIHKTFWRNMFKYHTLKQYGWPQVIDGWIVKFFPYNNEGKKNTLKEVYSSADKLPNEMAKTELKFMQVNPDGSTTETPLELWAGFIGLKQDTSDFNLKPQIGWVIRKKDKSMFADIAINRGGIRIKVKTFPEEIISVKELQSLTVTFIDSIYVPDEIKNMRFRYLSLEGELAPEKADKLIVLLENIPTYDIRTSKYYISKDTRDAQHPVFEDTRFITKKKN